MQIQVYDILNSLPVQNNLILGLKKLGPIMPVILKGNLHFDRQNKTISDHLIPFQPSLDPTILGRHSFKILGVYGFEME